VTDVDDPLLERATAIGVDWQDLAASQVDLFRSDMVALGIIPPNDYVAVTDVVDEIAAAVAQLWDAGVAYPVTTSDSIVDTSRFGTVESAGSDIYFDIAAAEQLAPWTLGEESNLTRPEMLALSAERGGDPERPGKRDPLDPLLWRAARAGEPFWPSPVGAGRPGWHIECSVIALKELGTDFTVQGGGSDLVFPHHDMSAGHAAALSGHPLAGVYSHTGMVAYQGEKMSKSLGNLVLVSRLRASGVDARAIRLALLGQHYRTDWEWSDAHLDAASARLGAFAAAFGVGARPGPVQSGAVIEALRTALVNDLDTPGALAVLDAAASVAVDNPAAVGLAVHALLGVAL
jgi:L-cysteine:1D-myo-inositol 2-amino-2-deoxy-alpha-D-glucopyranoside ligase